MNSLFNLPNTLNINGETYCSNEAVGAHNLWCFIEPGKLVIEGRIYSKVNFDRLMAGQGNVHFSRAHGYELAETLGSSQLAHEMGQAKTHEPDCDN